MNRGKIIFSALILVIFSLAGCVKEEDKGKLTLNLSSYTSGQAVEVLLKDGNLDTSKPVAVKVVSESDTKGIVISLTWDKSKQAFVGSFNFSGTESDDALYITKDEKFRVYYADSDQDDDVIVEGTVDFVSTELFCAGTVTFDEALYSIGSIVNVEVVDTDLTSATVNVDVAAASQSTGISVVLSKGSLAGTYNGSFTLVSDVNDTNKLKCVENDSITVSYNDSVPVGTRTDSADVAAAGTIDVVQTKIDAGDIITIYVEDDDLGEGDTVSVSAVSSADADGVTADLTWNSSLECFVGHVQTSSSSVSGKLTVDSGDTVTVSYTDTAPVVTVSDTCEVSNLAVLEFLDPYVYMTESTAIRLVDPDLDTTEEPVVHVVSASDSTGIDITLSYNSGNQDFRGNFNCSDEVLPGSLYAEGGDIVTLTYNDNHPSESVLAVNHVAYSGELTLDGSSTLGKKYAPGSTVNIELKDLDVPITAKPIVTVDSSQSGADDLEVELSWNSASERFEGSFVPVVNDQPDPGQLYVNYGKSFTVIYEDAVPVGYTGETIGAIYSKGFFLLSRKQADGSWLPVNEIVIDNTEYRIKLNDSDLSGNYAGVVISIQAEGDGPRVVLSRTLDEDGCAYFYPEASDQPNQDCVECYWKDNLVFSYDDTDLGEVLTKTLLVVYDGILSLDNPTGEYADGEQIQFFLVDKDLSDDTVTVTYEDVTGGTSRSMVLTWNNTTKKYESALYTLTTLTVPGPGQLPVTVGHTYRLTYTDEEFYDGEGANGEVFCEFTVTK
jgi:hypothetical protein